MRGPEGGCIRRQVLLRIEDEQALRPAVLPRVNRPDDGGAVEPGGGSGRDDAGDPSRHLFVLRAGFASEIRQILFTGQLIGCIMDVKRKGKRGASPAPSRRAVYQGT
jgi:hypothetical protein